MSFYFSKKKVAKKTAGSTTNKKVKNATKVDEGGRPILDVVAYRLANPDKLVFDSTLEWFCWRQLKIAGIDFEFQKQFILQPGFRYRGEAIRPITFTLDFYLSKYDIIVDPKGHQLNDGNSTKIKWLLYCMFTLSYNPRIVLLKTQKDINNFIFILKSGNLTLLDHGLKIPKKEKAKAEKIGLERTHNPLPPGDILTPYLPDNLRVHISTADKSTGKQHELWPV